MASDSLAAFILKNECAIVSRWRRSLPCPQSDPNIGYAARASGPSNDRLSEAFDLARIQTPLSACFDRLLPQLVRALAEGRLSTAQRASLADCVRLLAVQDVAPSLALGFICTIRDIVRQECGDAAQTATDEEWQLLDRAIDELVLTALDFYVESKARMHKAAIDEERRRTAHSMHRHEIASEARTPARPSETQPDRPERGWRP